MKRHCGFTLIEMLMVIIIIGALTATVMLSVSSATDKANASKIVSNLRSLKAACIMYYADNERWPSADTYFDGVQSTDDGIKRSIESYLDKIPEKGYKIYAAIDGTNGCTVSYSNADVLTDNVKDKLKKMASNAGLYSSNASNATVYDNGDEVFMKVTNSAQGTK